MAQLTPEIKLTITLALFGAALVALLVNNARRLGGPVPVLTLVAVVLILVFEITR